MKLHNYMEDLVEDVINEVLAEPKNFCTCELCRTDVAARVLNRMPARYVATQRGSAFIKLETLSVQFRTDVLREVTQSMACVAKNPRH